MTFIRNYSIRLTGTALGGLFALRLEMRSKQDARKERDHDDRDDDERGSDVHDL